jgi:hypothetical protein
MNNQDNIKDELRGMNSNLPDHNSQNPFSVPEGYFDGLAASILAKVKGQSSAAADELKELSPLLASLSKEMPYSLPAGYFEENLSALPCFAEEIKSPVLAAIGKHLPYGTPQGYFENLPQQVLAKVAQPKAKVVPLFARTWMRVAVAAVMGGVIFLSGYQYFNSAGDGQVASQQPVDTSKNWVAKNDHPVVQDIKKASTKELEEFINTVPVTPQEKTTAGPTEKTEVKNRLKDVSVKEIDAFLEQLPAVDDELALID